MMIINFIFSFLAGHIKFIGIFHNYKIADILIRRKSVLFFRVNYGNF